jgi:hypothetical protein
MSFIPHCLFRFLPIFDVSPYIYLSYDGRFGVVVGIFAYYARGRGFDSRTVQTFVYMNISVCIGSGCFYVIIRMYLQKKMYISMYLFVI